MSRVLSTGEALGAGYARLYLMHINSTDAHAKYYLILLPAFKK